MTIPLLTVTRVDDFSLLQDPWNQLLARTPADTIFLTWQWQELWWRTAGSGDLHLLTIREQDDIVGLAPLIHENDTWSLAGGVEVADFLDVIAEPAHGPAVAGAVLDYVERHGGGRIELRNLRPDALLRRELPGLARGRGYRLTESVEDVSPRLDLPSDWDSYLSALSKKDRHELRRKMRRLQTSGNVRYFEVNNPATRDADLADFVRLHRLSDEAKANFMTPEMERFFGVLVDRLTPLGWLKLYFMELDGIRVATLITFDYGNEFLLYNSGFDPFYAPLSVGLLLKAFTLLDAIKLGRRGFDFLQGNEPYKYDLGAVDVLLYRLEIERLEMDAHG